MSNVISMARGRRPQLAGRLAATALVAGLAVGATTLAPGTAALAQDQSAGVATAYGRAPLTFADVVEKVDGAVVNVFVTNGKNEQTTMPGAGPRQGPGGLPEFFPDLPDDHPLNEFFKRFNPEGKRANPRSQAPRPNPSPSLAQGSGFIISADGYVVTNNHVVDEASAVQITINGDEKLDAEVIGTDPRTDLALLKIKSDRTFPFVKFSEKKVRVGDWVIAVGNPFGLGGTVTAGIVSAHNRDIGSGPYDYIQIDAAVNRGNSGGPAFNLDGEVIGVNTAIFSPSGGNVGIAFAVPAELASQVITQLKDNGSVSRGWLGVHIQNITPDIAESLEMKSSEGALVTKITADGPSDGSELQVGDAITAVNGKAIASSRDLARTIADLSPDSDANITVFRNGQVENVVVKLGKFPNNTELASMDTTKPATKELDDLGLTLAPASEAGAEDQEGVVITEVASGSKAAEIGLQAGDVILKVDLKKVNSPAEVEDVVAKARERNKTAITLFIKRGNDQRFVGLPLSKG